MFPVHSGALKYSHVNMRTYHVVSLDLKTKSDFRKKKSDFQKQIAFSKKIGFSRKQIGFPEKNRDFVFPEMFHNKTIF